MAKIEAPSFAAMSGKIGNTVFRTTRYGIVASPRVTPANPKTDNQRKARGGLGTSSTFSAAWKSLINKKYTSGKVAGKYLTARNKFVRYFQTLLAESINVNGDVVSTFTASDVKLGAATLVNPRFTGISINNTTQLEGNILNNSGVGNATSDDVVIFCLIDSAGFQYFYPETSARGGTADNAAFDEVTSGDFYVFTMAVTREFWISDQIDQNVAAAWTTKSTLVESQIICLGKGVFA